MDYPQPLVVPPRRLPHRQTFILLHGRGSSGDKFGPVLLDTPISPRPTTSSTDTATATAEAAAAGADATLTLGQVFPHARFVFPTAPRRRATLYRRTLTRQWFDSWTLEPPATDREELQVLGLSETTAYLHDLWRREIAAVPGGAASVVVGGLSQGCAASLVALLLWQGDAFAAVVGMCGWLPFAARLAEHASPAILELDVHQEADGHDESFDPFEREDDNNSAADMDPPTRAIAWLREEIAPANHAHSTAARTRTILADIPIFLGHGTEDQKVSIVLGREASSCLHDLGAGVCWKEYEALAHWYSGDLLQDMVRFIQAESKWAHQEVG
ncbi:Phospholipase/carboxylesterase/thioesterase [Niveomyces insectorum RCEF 264]|uniref:Phospholipase/carboxylesterase/thioesterase n=1 Tax=Niveomyces insectorum RCEF 264 TaxID=1081102 RepID=A0A168AED5_9HYPO|nr:Phospholipase/carboxylesterase/thioesterase [Niveomyces insectorum RCEF 264]